MFDGQNDRIIREHNSMAWGAYHTAAWVRSHGKLPRFDRIIVRKNQSRRAQSPEEMLNVIRLLNAMHGGTVEGEK